MIEVNGKIVKSHSHKDVLSMLQSHGLGPVQMVVSRSLLNGKDDNRTAIETTNHLEEKLARELSLNKHWQKENQRYSILYQ